MTATTVAIVLFAALLHALWNALVKGAADRVIILGLIAFGHVVPGLVIVWLVDAPAPAAFGYIVASTIIHWGYYWFLNAAYRGGDLSIVYPIARGLSPVLIALGAQFWVGEILPLFAWAGIFLVSVGIMFLSFSGFGRNMPLAGIGPAVATGALIAAYSLVDGVGVRISGNALGYIGWLFVAELFVASFIFATRWQRLRALPAKTVYLGFLGGVISAVAYGLVLYAKTLAPLGVVSALRETSVIFAAMIGVMWFGEGPNRNRIFAAIIVTAGIVMIGLAS